MNGTPRRVAIVGSGIAGLTAADQLAGPASATPVHVTLFEAGAHFGGHTHTVDVRLPDAHGRLVEHGVDTGFLVFNHRTYPGLVQLFDELGVATAPSDMSFSVQVPNVSNVPNAQRGALEWSGSDLNTVFAQRGNLVRPRFWQMLADIVRFNRVATALAREGDGSAVDEPIGEFLQRHRLSTAFRDWYLLPMLGCIWSCPTDQMLRFPVATMVRFCDNHGLLQVTDRPQWHTVRGGARHYVDKLLRHVPDARLHAPVLAIRQSDGGALVSTAAGTERFDAVVLACHAPQALALLTDATPQERRLLGAIRTQANRAVLHTDPNLLPRRRAAWAAWNYERSAQHAREQAAVCLHYWMNRLQPLPFAQPVIVSLNPVREPAAGSVLGTYAYAHPVFDLAAIAAQRELPALQGHGHRWFCGAWTGYGFHEDGLQSGQAAARAVQRSFTDHRERVAA